MCLKLSTRIYQLNQNHLEHIYKFILIMCFIINNLKRNAKTEFKPQVFALTSYK